MSQNIDEWGATSGFCDDSFIVSTSKSKVLFVGLSSSEALYFANISEYEYKGIFSSLREFFIGLASYVQLFDPERDNNNNPLNSLPPSAPLAFDRML